MRRFLRIIYLYQFLDDFILVFPVYALLFQDNGLNTFQISLLFIIWSLVTVVLEVPTGALADKYSRRNLLILGEIIRALGYGFWLIERSFVGFALGFILWGIKGVLTSGTKEAFVYDELKNFNREQEYEKVNGRIKATGNVGIVLALVIGGFVAQHGYVLVLIPSILFSLLAGLVLLLIKPAPRAKPTEEIKYFSVLKKALLQARSNRVILSLMGIIALVYSPFIAVDEFWPLVFRSIGFNIQTIGLLVAAIYAVTALAGYSVDLFKGRGRHFELLLFALGGLLFITAGFLEALATLVLVLTASYLIQVAYVKLDSKLQHSIESKQRATISSVQSLTLEIVVIVFTLGLGIVANRFGAISLIIFSGAATLAGAFVSVIGRTNKKMSWRN